MPADKTKLIGLAAVVLVVSLVVIIHQARPPSPRGPERAWFYDLNTQQLFPAMIHEIPPIAAPSGPLPDGNAAGVKAHVYSCGDCAAAHRVVAYLETYTPEQQRQIQQWNDRARRTEPLPEGQRFVPGLDFMGVQSGQAAQIKRPDNAEWVVRGSPEGTALVNDALPRCPSGIAPQECRP